MTLSLAYISYDIHCLLQLLDIKLVSFSICLMTIQFPMCKEKANSKHSVNNWGHWGKCSLCHFLMRTSKPAFDQHADKKQNLGKTPNVAIVVLASQKYSICNVNFGGEGPCVSWDKFHVFLKSWKLKKTIKLAELKCLNIMPLEKIMLQYTNHILKDFQGVCVFFIIITTQVLDAWWLDDPYLRRHSSPFLAWTKPCGGSTEGGGDCNRLDMILSQMSSDVWHCHFKQGWQGKGKGRGYAPTFNCKQIIYDKDSVLAISSEKLCGGVFG